MTDWANMWKGEWWETGWKVECAYACPAEYIDYSIDYIRADIPREFFEDKDLYIRGRGDLERVLSTYPERSEIYIVDKMFRDSLDDLPASSHLKGIFFFFNSDFCKEIKNLPETIEELSFGHAKYFKADEIGRLPKGLKKLEINGDIKGPLSDVKFPQGLQKLRLFSSTMQRDIPPNFFPSGLKMLSISNYEGPIKRDTFPAGLTHLRFGWFNMEIEPGLLPEGLLYIELELFDQTIQTGVLPETVTHLMLRRLTRKMECGLPSGLLYMELPLYKHDIPYFPHTLIKYKLGDRLYKK
jgi:FNIP Repeat